MTIAPAPDTPTRLTKANMVGIIAGNVLEFYDFTVFAFFAPQIGASMFAGGTGTDGLLLALATFAVGFLARPFGAAIIGRYADTVGRKPAMLLSFSLMGIALLVVALTPPSSVLGIWSAVIISLARLVQGFALGGEVGPTVSLLIEAAPPHRRGTYGAWHIASQGLATLVAGVIGLSISSVMEPQAVTDWGWRIALLIGALVLPIGFYLRRIMPETLEKHAGEQSTGEPAVGQGDSFSFRRVIFIGLLLILSGTVTTYTLQYFNTYCISILKLPPHIAFTVTASMGVSLFAFGLLGGWLSDLFGRRALLVAPRLILLLLVYPVFVQIIGHPTLGALSAGVFLLTALHALSTATANVVLAEGFPQSKRSTAYALTYTMAVSVFGGSAQFLITLMIRHTGSDMIPAWWLIGATLAGLGAGLVMPVVQLRSLSKSAAALRAA
jgi:MFS family permease